MRIIARPTCDWMTDWRPIDYGAIVPQEPDQSLLVERILSDDPDLVMPPAKGGKKLSASDKKKLDPVDSSARCRVPAPLVV